MVSAAGLVVMLGLLAGQARAPGQASPTRYVLQFAKAGPGATVRVEKQDTQIRQVRLTEAGGKVIQDGKEEQTDTIIYRETIVEKPAGLERATHLWRRFDKAVRQTKDGTAGLPAQGQTYEIVKKNGRYEFHAAGGAAIPPQTARALEQEFNAGGAELLPALLPREPVPVGGSWKADPARIIGILGSATGLKFDAAHAQTVGRLTQVLSQNGRLFAVVDAEVNLPATATLKAAGWQALEPGSGVRVRLRLTGALDRGPELLAQEMQVEVTSTFPAPGSQTPQRLLTLRSACTFHQMRRELPRQ